MLKLFEIRAFLNGFTTLNKLTKSNFGNLFNRSLLPDLLCNELHILLGIAAFMTVQLSKSSGYAVQRSQKDSVLSVQNFSLCSS